MAALERHRWPALLGEIAAHCGFDFGYFHTPSTKDAPDGSLRQYITHNMDNDWLEANYYHYAPQDTLSEAMLKAVGGDHRQVLSVLESRQTSDALNSAYYQEYCRAMNHSDFMTLLLAPLRPKITPPTIGFCVKWGGDPVTTGQKTKLQALAPHLQRVSRLMFDVLGDKPLDSAAQISLDHMPVAAMLLSENGKILHINPAGEREIAKYNGLHVRNAQLNADTFNERTILERLIDRATRPKLGIARRGGEMTIIGLAGEATTVLVMPLGGDNPFVEYVGPCRAAIYLLPHSDTSSFPGKMRLSQLFGLTAAEAEVAFALISGVSPEEIAVTRDRSIATIRSQIRIILEKTSLGRISDLRGLLRLVEMPTA